MACEREENESKSLWTRPPGPPKVWFTVEGKKRGDEKSNIKFSIQEIPEDRHEDVVQLMITKFVIDEPLCRSLDAVNNPEFLESSAILWRQVLKQGLTVGAFVDDPNGGKPIIAGVNILSLDFKAEELKWDDYKFKSAKLQKLISTLFNLCKTADVYNKYGVDRYLSGLGLFVDPQFRGQSLSIHILNARRNIGREYGILATSTAFTSSISQKQAERCGYEVLFETDYSNVVDNEGNEIFPNVQVKTFKVMGRRLD